MAAHSAELQSPCENTMGETFSGLGTQRRSQSSGMRKIAAEVDCGQSSSYGSVPLISTHSPACARTSRPRWRNKPCPTRNWSRKNVG